MNAALGRQDQLLAALRELAHSDRALPCDCFRGARPHTLKAVDIDRPTLVLPLQGTKRVRDVDGWISTTPGQVLVIPNARPVDVENVPDVPGGEYVAIAIPINDNVLEAARQLLSEPVVQDRGRLTSVALGELVEPFIRWLDAMLADQKALACHAITGIVMRLYEMGHSGLLMRAKPTLSAQVRAMVAADPARDWSSPQIETAFAISGATLRRRLAEEGASLRTLIADARLARSIQLLMTTRLPIKTVAARVGYASASSFVKRFAERYGVEPSRVGGR